MKAIKIAGTLACVILVLLSSLFVFTKRPESALYQETIRKLMDYEGLHSMDQVKKHFPELIAIQNSMYQIGYLNRNINSLTAGPTPNLSSLELAQLKDYACEVFQLEKTVELALEKLLEPYENVHP